MPEDISIAIDTLDVVPDDTEHPADPDEALRREPADAPTADSPRNLDDDEVAEQFEAIVSWDDAQQRLDDERSPGEPGANHEATT